MELENADHGTILNEEEKEGLMIAGIMTLSQLNEHEQKQIEETLQWLILKSLTSEQILSEKFVRDLHKRMFHPVWKWAGTFRRTDKNIGIQWHQIPVSLKQLLDDSIYWIDNNIYTSDEIAIRFKHRLVSIHCFPNGNGRHSRLMADIIIEKVFNLPVFSWGGADLKNKGDVRDNYITSLKKADQGDYGMLMHFARS